MRFGLSESFTHQICNLPAIDRGQRTFRPVLYNLSIRSFAAIALRLEGAGNRRTAMRQTARAVA